MSQPNTSAVDRRAVVPRMWPVLVVIASGGVIGTVSRYGLQLVWPHVPGAFPWATFGINVSGCLLIGALMVLVHEVWPGQRLLRPFLGVGVLGGYTTFSTYAIDVERAVAAQAPAVALVYLATTLFGALLAVWAGATLTTVAVRLGRRAGMTDGGRR